MIRKAPPHLWIVLLLALIFTLGACQSDPQSATVPPTEAFTPTVTPFPPLPTVTPIALVAQVNGENITAEVYQAEVKRYESAVGTKLATENTIVLNYLIDQLLLAQAAADEFTVDETVLADHLEALNLSDDALAAWMAEYDYSQAEFEQAVSNAIAAAWMRDQIIAEVPTTAEQVHARQILVYTLEEAEKIYAQLETGTSFETLAGQYAPKTLGDLGWFPRGYLTVSELDDIIFKLAPNEYSTIIETQLGYHIIQVLEHEQKAKLSPAAQRLLESQAVTKWLNDQRALSEIIVFKP